MARQLDPAPRPRVFRRPLFILVPLALLILASIIFLDRQTPASLPPTATATPAVAAQVSPAATAAPSATPVAPEAVSPTAPAPTATPALPPDTPVASVTPAPAASPTTAAQATAAPALSADATLAALQAARVPARDLFVLTQQIKVQTTDPLTRTVDAPAGTRRVGDKAVFNVNSTTAGSYYTVTAVLQDVTAHAYWWVAQDDDLDLAALKQSASRFESKIFPSDTATFGDPPAVGPDNDPHLNVLNTQLDGVTAGYFSASDMYTQVVNPYSNGRKMIYIDQAPGTSSYEATLAHEFQHMIHWNVHPNQGIWINEGMAELAMKIAGYDVGGVEATFESNPNIQLNNWSTPVSTTFPHYGAAYLFMNYLYGRYGAGMIRAIMQAPGTDIDSIDEALAAQGHTERFADVFADWALANWLDKQTTDPRWRYPQLQVQVPPRTTLAKRPAQYADTVQQQAADYLLLSGSAAGGTVAFAGDSTVPLIGAQAHSGTGLWWSNRGDVSAPSLMRDLDLRSVSKATLSYWTWYEIEDGYDYAYAEVSTDGGQTWATLPGPATTADNPNGNNLGHGYTGVSGGGTTPAWIQEQIDLSPYAGHAIKLRFQYITDDGVNLQGFAVDDIRVPEIGYADDAEAPGMNGWTADGFVHVTPTLPEHFMVALISQPSGQAPTVTFMPLDAANQGSLPLPGTGRAVLMVAPLAPATLQPGHYTVNVR